MDKEKDVLKHKMREQEELQDALKRVRHKIMETREVLASIFLKEQEILEEIASYSRGTVVQMQAIGKLHAAQDLQRARYKICEQAEQVQKDAEMHIRSKQDKLQQASVVENNAKD